MKWIGYGLQGIGGAMAVTGLGVFALGKLVERAALGGSGDVESDPAASETEALSSIG
jgi:hypothetical protein